MKIARFFAWIFGILGMALMVFSIGLCLVSRNKPVELKEVPAGAVECAEALRSAISAGDYGAISAVLYGQPDLGADRKPTEETGIMIWDAFAASVSFEWKGDCYATDTGIVRDAVIKSMDIPGTMQALDGKAHSLLTARVEAATDMTELYDEHNNFREDLVQDVLREAVVRVLAEDAQLVTREVTLQLVCRDGRWWVVPDSALLQMLTGGVA